jgi:hypothetical protein
MNLARKGSPAMMTVSAISSFLAPMWGVGVLLMFQSFLQKYKYFVTLQTVIHPLETIAS